MEQATFKRIEKLSAWRRIALHTWRRPSDPTVYGNLEVDMTESVRYIKECNERFPETPVTVTHLVVKAIAKALAAWPQSNAIVSRNRLYMRDSADVYCQVSTESGNDLSGVKIVKANEKSPVDIASELAERVRRVHAREDAGSEQTKKSLGRIPHSLLGRVLRLTEWLTYDLRLDLSRFGIAYDQFGGAMVSNVGVFGIGHGLAPLVPISRVPIVLLVGQVKDRPVAKDGEVVIAPVLTIGATFDHRVIDGFQAGRMAKIVIGSMEDPYGEFGIPQALNGRDTSADLQGNAAR